jgi:arsenate reductase
VILLAAFLLGAICSDASAGDSRLDAYIATRIGEFDQIPAERREKLAKLTAYMQAQRNSSSAVRLTFICTHNSRRSQMAQVWATIAANHYGISGVEVFSGGTESTAFNPRAVAALERAGVPIHQQGGSAQNPRYEVKNGPNALICFSKVYSDQPNPDSEFAAVMTCSEADKKCPIVTGAQERIVLPYDDPKASDGTDHEASTYDERCAQIAREMLFVFSQVQRADQR